MDGILIINKEKDLTSRDVVNKLSKILGTKKIGHTGTLDPMATGVLVICIGKCTKLVEMITSDYKEYIAGVKLGIMTDTLDTTGNIQKKETKYIEKEKIINTIKSFIGEYSQEVPIYSAVKINGKKLYEYARNKEQIKLPKRKVNIKNIEIISDIKYGQTIDFKIKCQVSKGTYIRSLIRDIATKLNTIGVMSSLTRTKQGQFTIEGSYTIKDIEKGNYKTITIQEYFKDTPQIIVDENKQKDILNGKIIDNIYNQDTILFIHENLALALYKTYEKDTTKLKPYKMFGGIK